MSIVVALKKDGVVYMGSDSLELKQGEKYIHTNPNNRQIFNVLGIKNMFMVMDGRTIESNLIRTKYLFSPKILKNVEIDFSFMVNYFVPRVFNILNSRDLIVKDEKTDIPLMSSDAIVVYQDKIYRIFPDGSVMDIDEFCALGEGSDEAYGSFITTEKEEDPIRRIILSLEAAINTQIDADYPIIITDTLTGEFKQINK